VRKKKKKGPKKNITTRYRPARAGESFNGGELLAIGIGKTTKVIRPEIRRLNENPVQPVSQLFVPVPLSYKGTIAFTSKDKSLVLSTQDRQNEPGTDEEPLELPEDHFNFLSENERLQEPDTGQEDNSNVLPSRAANTKRKQRRNSTVQGATRDAALTFMIAGKGPIDVVRPTSVHIQYVSDNLLLASRIPPPEVLRTTGIWRGLTQMQMIASNSTVKFFLGKVGCKSPMDWETITTVNGMCYTQLCKDANAREGVVAYINPEDDILPGLEAHDKYTRECLDMIMKRLGIPMNQMPSAGSIFYYSQERIPQEITYVADNDRFVSSGNTTPANREVTVVSSDNNEIGSPVDLGENGQGNRQDRGDDGKIQPSRIFVAGRAGGAFLEAFDSQLHDRLHSGSQVYRRNIRSI